MTPLRLPPGLVVADLGGVPTPELAGTVAAEAEERAHVAGHTGVFIACRDGDRGRTAEVHGPPVPGASSSPIGSVSARPSWP